MYTAARSNFMIKVIFAPMDRASLAETYRTGGLDAVRSAFADITTESAEASQEADAKAIREIITAQLPNGFATLDQMLREKLSSMVIETLADDEATTDGTDALTNKNLSEEIKELRKQLKEQRVTSDGKIEELHKQLAKQVTTRKAEEEMTMEQVEAVDRLAIEQALEHYPVATTAENATEVADRNAASPKTLGLQHNDETLINSLNVQLLQN